MRRQWISGLLTASACSILLLIATRCGIPAEGTSVTGVPVAEQAAENLLESRVLMARPEVFAALERPAVVFDHSRHTDALKEEGCRGCHAADEEGKVSYQYVEWRDLRDKKSLMDAYHGKCNACHYEGATEAGKKVRALGCGECHLEKADLVAQWYAPIFDHFPHLDAMEKGCDTCHHQYDEQQQKLVYVKGQEQACGKCHKEKPEDNRDSLRNVGHTGCIGCHEEQYLAGKIKLNPYECRGCHCPEAKPRQPEPREIVARTYQARPAQLLISYPGAILPPVPFDHEKHDPKKDCTKCCHNFHVRTLVSMDMRFTETASSCEECHKQAEVAIRPGCLQAEKIYHDKESLNSCVGCHIEKNKEVGKDDQRPVTCKGCHKGDVGTQIKLAEMRPADLEKGPEICIIDRVSRKYMPVKFPHLRHSEMIADCNSCHHHGPEKQKPACNTCHGEPMDFMKLTKPRLISAYHRMCMGCHRSMGAGPITCVKCHEERETIYPTGEHLQTVKTPESKG